MTTIQNDPIAGSAPLSDARTAEALSPWWRRASLITMGLGFAVLVLLTFKVYREAPPIADKVVGPDGTVVYTAKDVQEGQQVFLKYGLMDNGSIWGHGAMLGPDFSALFLHTLAVAQATSVAQQRYGLAFDKLTELQRALVETEVRTELKQNR